MAVSTLSQQVVTDARTETATTDALPVGVVSLSGSDDTNLDQIDRKGLLRWLPEVGCNIVLTTLPEVGCNIVLTTLCRYTVSPHCATTLYNPTSY